MVSLLKRHSEHIFQPKPHSTMDLLIMITTVSIDKYSQLKCREYFMETNWFSAKADQPLSFLNKIFFNMCVFLAKT